MFLFNKYLEKTEPSTKIATTHKLCSKFFNLPVIQCGVDMFRTENNFVRPRRNHQIPWNDIYNKKPFGFGHRPVFQIEDLSLKSEVPSSKLLDIKSNSTNNKSGLRRCYEHLEDYFSNSTLHGLKYVGNPSLSFGERLFWLCSFLCATAFAAYFISSLYIKYNLNPVIVSLNPKPTPLGTLPFPAITICSLNQARKPEAQRIMDSGTEVEKMMLSDYCKMNNSSSFSNASYVNDEAAKWSNVLKFILRVSPPCNDMLKVCFWKQEETPCGNLFNNGLTDDGLCCTFNALPRNYIFRNPREMSDLNLSFSNDVDDWTPENGYSENATASTLPWRAPGAGAHMGLTVVLDAQIKWYFCSSVNSVGFKVLLHNPLETPKMADFALLVPPGFETRVRIIPKIFDATVALRDIDISKRMCYFKNEKSLQFYRTYTERNCKLECQANFTLSMCSCVPFYLPKDKSKKICSKTQESCSNTAKEAMETQNGTSCNCLPGCFELGFDSTSTYGKLSDVFKVKEEIIKNESPAYFMENMAVVHFFFKESQFTRNTKSELYGFSEFLSNTGGLLGLFLGFSFLSVVEVLYYVSLKLLCTFIRSKNTKSKQKKDRPYNNALIHPFAQ